MNYFQNNKAAWEAAFEHRHPGWGEKNHETLAEEGLPFFNSDTAGELRLLDFGGKTIAQFCCNNGRELLSLMRLGAKLGIGFDIAENIIGQARSTAKDAGIENCEFVACNIMDIDEKYFNSFDFLMFTIGAITWFEDLDKLFYTVSECLKPGGILFINDFHPVMNMLPLPGEPAFDEHHLDRIVYSYFRKEPWIENEAAGYMSEGNHSETFTSFSHTMSDIVNAISNAQLNLVRLNEYDYDIGLSDAYDNKGLPLSYLLMAKKQNDAVK